jgi:chromosome segregation ATPase
MDTATDYKSTLNKMANLEDLSKFIVAQNAALEAKRGNLNKIITGMQSQVSKIRDQIDNIKSKGAVISTEMKQVINDSNTKQEQSLTNIKNSISSMIKMDKLETAVKGLENDISSLYATSASAGEGRLNPEAPAFTPEQPAATGPAATASEQSGGYTYGKSRKRGKGRRKRTKKSRKKGSNKK